MKSKYSIDSARQKMAVAKVVILKGTAIVLGQLDIGLMGIATFFIGLSNIVLPRVSGRNFGPPNAIPLTHPELFVESALNFNELKFNEFKLENMTHSFSSVPQVDYARLQDKTTRQEELDKLRNAIFVVGFLYLTNTGLEV